MIYTASFSTAEEIRNYKSLEAYKYFIDGWVIETLWRFYDDVFLLVGKVKHSYSLSETPLKPWVAVRKTGKVECGHCTCMAGLAESCSHVAALLFWLETAVRIHNDTTCTSRPNSWLAPTMPTPCNHVPYVTLEELEVVALKRKRKGSQLEDYSKYVEQHKPTKEELQEFYEGLNAATDIKPALLSLIPEYSSRFVQSSDHFPPVLHDLYDHRNIELNYTQLLVNTNQGSEPLTDGQVKHLEESTRGQASNHLWFKYRAGRITASQFYQVRMYENCTTTIVT